MKIAIPVKNKSIESNISESLSRANYFLVYDTDNDELLYIENKGKDVPSGAGIRAVQEIANEDVKIVIAIRCGDKATQAFTKANITLLKAIDKTVRHNLEAFKSNALEKIDNICETNDGGLF